MKLAEKKARAQEIYNILCELYPQPQAELNYTHDYEFLFAVIMSAQTTDKQVNKLTEKLYIKYPTLDSFATADIDELMVDMSSIGLFRAKAKNVKAAANMLIERFNRKVPETIEEIITIPGAARKTANVVTGDLHDNPQGIAVDTHVKRLSRQLGLSKHEDVVKIEKDLMKLFPQKEWSRMSLRLILYGRYHWPARSKEHTGPLAKFEVSVPKKRVKRKKKST